MQQLLRRCLRVAEPSLNGMDEVRLEIERAKESSDAGQAAAGWRLIAVAVAMIFLVAALLKLSGFW